MNLAQRIMMGNSVCEDIPLPIGYGLPGPDCGQYDPVTDTGYYGFVPSAELISGDALASLIGLTAGLSQHSDAGWFKFYVGPAAACNRNNNGYAYVAYVAKMPNRHSISWNQINAVNAVYGNRREPIQGMNCQVRLITGAGAALASYPNPRVCSAGLGNNSEWNELFYRINGAVPDCSNPTIGMEGGYSTQYHGGPQSGSNWANYTNEETGVQIEHNNGAAAWAMENAGPLYLHRGYSGVAFYGAIAPSSSTALYGWRPVIQPTSLDPDSDPYDFSV